MKAIIYTRYSPQRNGKDSESCEVQAAYCEDHAAREGWEVADTLEDREKSGGDADRPNLWAAVDLLGKGDVLLVWKLDRLARSLYLMEGIRLAVERRGARIVAVEGDIEGNSPEVIMIRQILGSVYEYERKIIAQRTKAAMRHKQRNGISVSSKPPYGYRIEGENLVEVEEEQKGVDYVRYLHKRGYDDLAIVRAMNGSEHRTRSGRPWRRRDIENIISNLKVDNL